MLEANQILEERLELVKLKQKQILDKTTALKNFYAKGDEFQVNSYKYFKYSVKIVLLTAFGLGMMIALIALQLYLLKSDFLQNQTGFYVLTALVIIMIMTLVFSGKQKSNLQQLKNMNISSAGWYEDIVGALETEIKVLVDEYQELTTDEDFIEVLDDASLGIIKSFEKYIPKTN